LKSAFTKLLTTALGSDDACWGLNLNHATRNGSVLIHVDSEPAGGRTGFVEQPQIRLLSVPVVNTGNTDEVSATPLMDCRNLLRFILYKYPLISLNDYLY